VKAFQTALDKAVKEAKAPGAVAFVGHNEKTLLHGASGYRALTPIKQPAQKNTLYDLASLTKVVCTTTSILLLNERGKLDLEQPVSEFIPIPSFSKFSIRHLLTHTSGLQGYKVWYKETEGLDAYVKRIGTLEQGWKPGTRRNYSDLGFMLLAKVVETVARDSLDAFAQENIFGPLKMSDTGFKPEEKRWKDCAATEECAWRGKVMQGEVHDENAYAIGGVSGHAGLFAPAADLAKFCRAMIGGKVLKRETLDAAATQGVVPTYPWQGLGWKMDPWKGGSEGHLSSRRAIGHTGWTGTSIWMDLDEGHFSILLSNTPHPDRRKRQNRTLRQTFHKPVAKAAYPRSTNAHTGLDRVVWDHFDPLKGKRVALLTNQGAVDELGRHILDVLALNADVEIARLFSPEHGFTGQAEAGEKVGAQRASAPVVSLYGKQKKPTLEQLKDIDLFVVDLPDIGARYYTYMATMKACMEACAAAKVPVHVLDRPNPLGGAVTEGPVATRTNSLVCSAPIPIRHGMTLGELALFYKQLDGSLRNLKLTISRVDNWPRTLMVPQNSLPWVAPSPNIPRFESALLYIGICLFEGVNLNEGRGTDTPFQRIGAPWLNPQKVIDSLKPFEYLGCTLSAEDYTPRSIPGKSTSPRYKDERCHGIRIELASAVNARPFTLAYGLLRAIVQHHPGDLEWRDFFDTLAGGDGLRRSLVSGTGTERYLDSISAGVARFQGVRPTIYSP
jgi:uncharacterized protein YbbC (DUF1343 family)/CubicO group peptidase (beta-lactamase class C family)